MAQLCVGVTPSLSTTFLTTVQRYFVQYTVPALSSGGSAESTQTIAGLTTSGIYILQPRIANNSTVVGVQVLPRCSTANSLCLTFSNNTISTLSGSTNSGYLLHFGF